MSPTTSARSTGVRSGRGSGSAKSRSLPAGGGPGAVAVDVPDLRVVAGEVARPDDGAWMRFAEMPFELSRASRVDGSLVHERDEVRVIPREHSLDVSGHAIPARPAAAPRHGRSVRAAATLALVGTMICPVLVTRLSRGGEASPRDGARNTTRSSCRGGDQLHGPPWPSSRRAITIHPWTRCIELFRSTGPRGLGAAGRAATRAAGDDTADRAQLRPRIFDSVAGAKSIRLRCYP
jgi:hypothetical protein